MICRRALVKLGLALMLVGQMSGRVLWETCFAVLLESIHVAHDDVVVEVIRKTRSRELLPRHATLHIAGLCSYAVHSSPIIGPAVLHSCRRQRPQCPEANRLWFKTNLDTHLTVPPQLRGWLLGGGPGGCKEKGGGNTEYHLLQSCIAWLLIPQSIFFVVNAGFITLVRGKKERRLVAQ